MTTRLLLVDDEPNVLRALERRLHPLRQEWCLRFAGGGAEALALLEEEPADVVITDLHMPGVDGAQLLAEVARRYPDTIRIILSGHSDEAAMLRMAVSAHQFVAKPCQTAQVIDAVRRALRLRERMADPDLQRLVTGLRSLPALPHIFVDLQRELAVETASLATVADLIAGDVGLTATILHIANSNSLGTGRTIATPVEALQCLGLDTIRALVLEQTMVTLATASPSWRHHVEYLTRHSRITAAVARGIAEAESLGPQAIGHAFMAGQLHDIGSLLLAGHFPDREDRVARAARGGGDLCAAERREFGASHADVGAYLMGLWGLPDPVVEAISDHHAPAANRLPECDVLMAVHAASALVHDTEVTGAAGDHGTDLDLGYLGALGVLDRLPGWRRMVDQITQASS